MMELTASRAFSLQCFWDSKLDTFMTDPPASYLTPVYTFLPPKHIFLHYNNNIVRIDLFV